jgi:hypothetical protein
MDQWSKFQSSLSNINFTQAGTKFAKTFNSGVQATRERLGQISPDEITELPQGTITKDEHFLSFAESCHPEYKDLEARVDALRAAHLSLLRYVVETSFSSYTRQANRPT